MSTDAAYDYLLSLPRFAREGEAAYRPGLDRIESILAEMGRPQEQYDIVHVAGTNGKGSTASMIAAIWTAYGYRTGLHTSPHLLDVTERMRVDGTPASNAWLTQAVERWRPVFERYRPSFFEATVALSFQYFAHRQVDWAVVEVGMGGRLDATNVVLPRMAIITHIGRDHRQWLGESLHAIAREKAGIIKERVPVCVGDLSEEALRAVREVANERSAPLHIVPEEVSMRRDDSAGIERLYIETLDTAYRDVVVGIPGMHQQANSLIALRAAELLLPPGQRRKHSIVEGLAHVTHLSGLRGRLERVLQEPPIIADVAHNEESLAVTLQGLTGEKPVKGRLVVLLGIMADKDISGMARLLREAGAEVWPVALEGDRALSTSDMRAVLEQEGVAVSDRGDVPSAVRWFRQHAGEGDLMLATGSHRVVAGLLRACEMANR